MRYIIIDDDTNEILYDDDCQYCAEEDAIDILNLSQDIKGVITHKEVFKGTTKIWLKKQ